MYLVQKLENIKFVLCSETRKVDYIKNVKNENFSAFFLSNIATIIFIIILSSYAQ